MKIEEQFFGVKERIITLERKDIVSACLDIVNKKYPATDMQECTRTNWFFLNKDGEDITDDVVNFIFVESFKKDHK